MYRFRCTRSPSRNTWPDLTNLHPQTRAPHSSDSSFKAVSPSKANSHLSRPPRCSTSMGSIPQCSLKMSFSESVCAIRICSPGCWATSSNRSGTRSRPQTSRRTSSPSGAKFRLRRFTDIFARRRQPASSIASSARTPSASRFCASTRSSTWSTRVSVRPWAMPMRTL